MFEPGANQYQQYALAMVPKAFSSAPLINHIGAVLFIGTISAKVSPGEIAWPSVIADGACYNDTEADIRLS